MTPADFEQPSYLTEGITVFIPHLRQTHLRGLLDTVEGLPDDLVPPEKQDPFGITGPYIIDCTRSLRQWMQEVGIDKTVAAATLNALDNALHLMHLRC